MPAGITSSDWMFSVRQTPWHGLGAVLDQPPRTIADAIERSGLGWRVEREPIAIDRGDRATTNEWWLPHCEEIPGWWANVRQDTRQVLGIVGARYRIVQNIEAFQFVDQLIGSAMHFETAGSLHGGRRVWVLAQLPEHIEVGGDPIRPYILLMNSHDGSTAVVAASTPIRVVCQNTLNWGLERARQKYSIRHTEKIREQVHQARRVLDLSIDYYQQFNAPATSSQPSDSPKPSYAGCSTSSTHPIPPTPPATEQGARVSRPSSASANCSSTATPGATRPRRSGPQSTRSSNTPTGSGR
jgi:phage/plasmid-like protein (TIGR03299 family)